MDYSFARSYLCTSAIAIGALLATSAEAEDRRIPMEALPPHLAIRVQQRGENLNPPGLTAIPRAVVMRIKVWQPESFPITVCFFGGSRDLRVRIMNAALDWTKHAAKIPLDFGNPSDPRICTSEESDIKIGYAYGGYWSLVGQDSRDLTKALEQSMNFEHWDVDPAPEPEFTQTVLHEFGHALGFEHEHQTPFASCESEFDWPAIYAYLAQPPNRWSKETVDFNMRQLNPEGLIGTPLDQKSIMLYTFPKEFYKLGEASKCFAKPNIQLSKVDIEFAASNPMYPPDAARAVSERNDAVATFAKALSAPGVSAGARSRAIQEIEVMSAPALKGTERRMIIDRLQAPSAE